MATVDELNDFYNRCAMHDWTHAMSDDNSVYLRGRNSERALSSEATSHDEKKRIFTEWKKFAFSRQGEAPKRPE